MNSDLQIKEGVIQVPRQKASVDNTLQDLQNSSYSTKVELNINCIIIHSKYFPILKGISPFCSLFLCSPNITPSHPQVFSINGSIICSRLYFWIHWFDMTKTVFKFGQQQLLMVNYACGFNQSDMGKYYYLQCVYWNRGHPDNENQSDGRTETIESNILKLNPANQMFGTKQWNPNLLFVMLTRPLCRLSINCHASNR